MDSWIALPVVIRRIDNGTPHRGGDVVIGPDGLGSLPQLFMDAARVRADQHLVGIEAVSFRRVRRAVYTKRVSHARPAAPDEHMPEMKGLVSKRIEPHDLRRFDVERMLEQQKLHFGRRLREEGEIDAARVCRHADRMRRTRLGFKRHHAMSSQHERHDAFKRTRSISSQRSGRPRRRHSRCDASTDATH